MVFKLPFFAFTVVLDLVAKGSNKPQMMRSVAGSSNATEEEEMYPIVRMEEEKVESLAPASAMCRFSPCRPDVAVVGNAFDIILLQSVADPTQASCSDSCIPLASRRPVLCNDKASD
jgi:hypothetical protein